MAKKSSIKVRLVPESKPNSPFFYYVKKPTGGDKAKIKLKAKKYNPVFQIAPQAKIFRTPFPTFRKY